MGRKQFDTMKANEFKLRLRRIIRRRKKIALNAADQAEQNLEKNFFRRLSHLYQVRRFIVGWIGLMLLLVGGVGLQARGLSAYYQKIAAVDGGTIREGMLGSFTTSNPLYATNQVDSSVAKLVFSGLFTRDAQNKLVPDLADTWEADEKGQVYTVHLHHGIKWNDGEAFTASDVAFTYALIQNPDAKSPLFSSWQGVKVQAKDQYTVIFELPNALASFPYSLVNGIVPKHLLKDIPAGQLRSSPFNTNPVGTGPFIWQSVEVEGGTAETRSEQVALLRNETYHRGAPRVDGYVLRTYRDEAALVKAYQQRELTAIAGISTVPDALAQDSTTTVHSVPLSGSVMLFLNNSSEILSDVKVRQALASATNRQSVLGKLGFSAISVDSPLLKGQLGYDPKIVERGFAPAEAAALLDAAGWKQETPGGIRTKAGKELKIDFVSQNTGEYPQVAQEIQTQWRTIGVNLDVHLRAGEDMQSTYLPHHEYDVLLYGISIGQDPDVFPYWHSSQVDVRSANRLNFSEYKSVAADKALEAGRTRTDPAVRVAKYKPFLTAWRDDAPAIALYQPRYVYITRNELAGFDAKRLGSAVDRLDAVHTWTVLQDKVLK